ncbi:MAG TPA: acyl-CoA dehydrogenase, partial [Blastocatellia bacterium]|nr:acyl-CoA dehydrogenase [Blastocatellia bacterium]
AFAIESALLRTEKLIANKGESNCRIAVEMVRTYASDALSRAAVNAGNLAAALDEPRRLRDAFERLSMQRPINTVAARRRIAEAMIEAGRYLW